MIKERRLQPNGVQKIRYKEERMVANFLQEIFPNKKLHYERKPYSITKLKEDRNNELKEVECTTLPDFELEDLELDQLVAVVEVTTNVKDNAKNDEKNLMEIALPHIPYIVLNGKDLLLIRFIYPLHGKEIFNMTDSLNRLGSLAQPSYFAAD